MPREMKIAEDKRSITDAITNIIDDWKGDTSSEQLVDEILQTACCSIVKNGFNPEEVMAGVTELLKAELVA